MDNKTSPDNISQEAALSKNSTRKLLVKIYQDDIEVIFNYKRATGSTKVNWFDTKAYQIPQQLLRTFDEKYKEHKSKKIMEIKKEMKLLLSQEEDWKDQLKIWSEIHPLGQAIVWLSSTENIEGTIEKYVYDRIFYKVLRQEWSSRQDQARIKTLTTGEKIKKFTPELKKIIDDIINDIHREFKIQIKRRDKDPFREDKYIKSEEKREFHREKILKNLWIHGQKNQYIVENLPHVMNEDEDRKDESFNKDSIYQILPRDRKLHKTTNQSKEKR